MEKAQGGGDRKSEEYHRSHDVTGDSSENPTYSDLGIGKMQASRWQLVASVPEEKGERGS